MSSVPGSDRPDPRALVRSASGSGRVDQLGFVVADIEAAIAKYTAVLGLGPFTVHDVRPESKPVFRFRGAPATYRILSAVNDGAPQLELVQPIDGPSPYAEHLGEHGPGLHHVGIHVADVAATTTRMTAAGYELIAEASGYGGDGLGAFAHYDTTADLGLVVEAIRAPRTSSAGAAGLPTASEG